MEHNARKDDLSKNETIDEGYFEYMTGTTKKTSESSTRKEEVLRKKARKLLEEKFNFSSNQILDSPKLEHDNEFYSPDMVVIDEETKESILVIQFQILKKTSQISKRQLKKYMNLFNISYGVILGDEEPEFLQKTNDVLIPIITIPDKTQIKQKIIPLTISQEISETIAKNMVEILNRVGFVGIESVVLSLQVLLVKRFDELNHDNSNFIQNSQDPDRSLSMINRLWDEFEIDMKGKYLTRNYFKNLSSDTARQLCLFIEKFSLKGSDISNLLKSLIENISSERFQTNQTPHHLLNMMYKFTLFSPPKNTHVVVTGPGDSVQKLISYLATNLKFTQKQIDIFIKNNSSFSIELSGAYDILVLYSFLSNQYFDLRFEAAISEEKFDINSIYDSIIIDGLVIKHLQKTEQREFQGLDYHDVLLSQSIRALRDSGRLAVLLPKTYLFQKKSFRDKLLHDCSVRAIIELPIMGMSYNNYNCALVIFEKNTLSEKPIFMAQHGTTKRSFFNAYDQSAMEKIFKNFEEFEMTGNLSQQSDSGFLISSSDLQEDWTVSRKLPSLKEKILKIKHPVQLRDIVTIISGTKIKSNDQRGIPYILISDFDDLSQKRLFPKSRPEFSRSINPKYLTKEGDILLSRSGTIGKIAIISKENENQLVSSGIAILRIKNKDIHPSHLKNELQKKLVQNQFDNFSQSTFNSYLNNEMIGHVIVNIPTIEEQQELGSKISEIEAKINEHTSQISELQEKLKKLREE